MKPPCYLVLAILATTGCAGTRPDRPAGVATTPAPGPTYTMKPPAAKTQGGELPPDQAAQACRRTAEELEKGGYDVEAVAHYERARQLAPDTPDVAWRLAIAQDRLGNPKAASAEFAKALAASPKNADVLNDAAHFATGRGDFKTAEKWLDEAVRIQPAHASSWANLGVVYAKTDRPALAEAAFSKAMPPPQAAYNLAVLLAGQGQTTLAKGKLRQALAQEPDLAAARDLLAKLPVD